MRVANWRTSLDVAATVAVAALLAFFVVACCQVTLATSPNCRLSEPDAASVGATCSEELVAASSAVEWWSGSPHIAVDRLPALPDRARVQVLAKAPVPVVSVLHTVNAPLIC